MEFIKTEWSVSVQYKRVIVVGTAPLCNEFINQVIKTAMITKAVELIDRAQRIGECIILSEPPNSLNTSNENKLEVYFSIMFQNQEMANQYANSMNV